MKASCLYPHSLWGEADLTDTATTAEVAAQEVARDRGLIRAVGTWGLAFSIVNGVVGAGIFSLPSAMTAAAGDKAALAYVLCAIAMAAVVICFAEAASRIPTSGGAYGYVDAAFGPLWGFVTGVLTWLASVLACGGIAAALADGIAAFVPAVDNIAARTLIILSVIGGFSWINIKGVDPAARAIGVMTAIKLIPLLLFVILGAFAIAEMPAHDYAPATGENFGKALILALFAFCGMETPLAVSGEVAEPQKTIPRALFISMGFVVVFYVAIQFVAQGLLGPKLAGSATPIADAMAVVSPTLGFVILIGASFSRLVWIGSDLFGAPRVLFAFARDGTLPGFLGALHPTAATPHVAILIHAAIAAALAITGTFEPLAILSTLATAGLYFLACAAAWKLTREGVALFGKPLGFRGMGAAAILGMASMIVLTALAEWAEIAGLIIVVMGSVAFYWAQAKVKQRH
ncbi:APC family permease [Sphingomonas crocodyli]|uniref:Arginine/agmatine antiporter n=1 Tax=Sphingomonas crocodyli TaxID=1979270 RepID=A0A437LWE4_9SPHN|nr:APC family permease [Sphingomonas crocodyli]